MLPEWILFRILLFYINIELVFCFAINANCRHQIADIVIVMDSSTSIGQRDFDRQISFVKNLVSQFDIGITDTQFSIVSFSTQVYNEFFLNTYQSKSSLLDAISRVSYHTGDTHTEKALSFVTKNSFKASHGGRPNVKKIVIVITDGQAQLHNETVSAANTLHSTGAEVIAVGIGKADQDELQSIATDNGHLFMVANYDVLNAIQYELQEATCAISLTSESMVQTTLPPTSELTTSNKENDCRHQVADIVIVMDSSTSIGQRDFDKQISFVKNLVSQFDIGVTDTQFSIVSFSSYVYNEFYLNTYHSKSGILDAISRIPYHTGDTHTEKALSFVTTNSFKASHGGRSNVKKIVIVITDGQAQLHDATVNAANLLHSTGAEVIAVGIGRADQDELHSIATDNAHLFMVANYDILDTIQHELQNATCVMSLTPGELMQTSTPKISVSTSTAMPQDCTHQVADIVIVMDSSTSIGQSDFDKQISFVKNLVSQFDIGVTDTQFSIVSFSSYVYNEFYLNTYHSKSGILDAISRIPYHTGDTHTEKALSFVTTNSFKVSNGGRPNVKKIVIVITDGQAQLHDATVSAANLLHSTGAEVIAVGIGRADQHELQNLATDDAHLFMVTNYDVLYTIQHELQEATCEISLSPGSLSTTPVTPKLTTVIADLQDCRHQIADIVIVMDSSTSIGQNDFDKQKNFIANLVSHFDIGANDTQFSIVSFSSHVYNEFYLNTHQSKAGLLDAISRIPYHTGDTHTEKALSFVTTRSFKVSHGGRSNVRKIVIVITDGQAQLHDATVSAANLLHSSGAEVIAVGIGRADQDELQSIATDNAHLFMVTNYDVLHAIQQELQFVTCNTMQKVSVSMSPILGLIG